MAAKTTKVASGPESRPGISNKDELPQRKVEDLLGVQRLGWCQRFKRWWLLGRPVSTVESSFQHRDSMLELSEFGVQIEVGGFGGSGSLEWMLLGFLGVGRGDGEVELGDWHAMVTGRLGSCDGQAVKRKVLQLN